MGDYTSVSTDKGDEIERVTTPIYKAIIQAADFPTGKEEE